MLATAVSGVGLSIALAALIFVGPLAEGQPRATSTFIVAGGILTGVIGWLSCFRPTVAILQDGPAIVLVTVAGSVALSSPDQPVVTVFVMMALIGALAGLTMVLVGHFGIGGVVRYFPTTVLSGFIAGTGWLLTKGGFEVMVDRALEASDAIDLLQPSVAKFWLPGVALALGVQVLSSIRRVPSIVVGVAVLASTAAFFLIAAVVSSVAEAEAANWFIGPFPDGGQVAFVTPNEIATADWSAMTSQFGGILAVVAVSLVAVLLNLSSLESITGQRLDIRSELRTTGAINIVAAPLGALVGFHAIGDTVLARQMGARTRAVPLGVGVLSIAAGVFGSAVVGFTPRFIAGGLLVAVGSGLLASWVASMLSTASRVERVLSAAILFLMAVVGILEGITFGLVAACLIFVVRYSRIDPVKLESTARETPSRVVRSSADRDGLAEYADQVRIFQLTGYQFFGSFSTVVERIKRSTQHEEAPVTFVVIDFRHVTGIDSSGFVLLDKLMTDLSDDDVTVLLSDLDPALARLVSSSAPQVFPGLDYAIEHAEEALLQTHVAVDDSGEATPFSDLSPQLMEALTRRSVGRGEIVIEQGAQGAALYLIISGDLVVTSIQPDGTEHRLRRIGSGTVVGERSVLLGEPRSARISAETDCELFEVTIDDYERLAVEQPELALELQNRLLVELIRRSVSLSEHLSMALR